LEEELWREETRFDIPYMEQVLAEDFFEIGRSGRIYRRQETLAVSRQPIDAILPLPGFDVRLLTEDVAQVTYNSVITYDGVLERGRRSSIWSCTPSGWVIRLHQGTPFDSVAQQGVAAPLVSFGALNPEPREATDQDSAQAGDT
jgi:hypothetical protein